MSDFDEAGQQWAGMNGAAAWALIDRHSTGWTDTERMMNAWLDANQMAVRRESEYARQRDELAHLRAENERLKGAIDKIIARTVDGSPYRMAQEIHDIAIDAAMAQGKS